MTPTGHEPPRTARSPPALTRHGPATREELGDAVDGVALADAAEVEAGAGLELDRRPVDADAAAAAARGGGRRSDRVRRHVVERAVVAGRDDGVVDGRVEEAAGRLAGLERELDDPHEVGARVVEPCRRG